MPPAVAEEIFALSNRAVRFLNKAGAQVGFLTEAEIAQRASEATSGEVADENPIDPTDEKDAEAEKPTEGPFITIKRAPLP